MTEGNVLMTEWNDYMAESKLNGINKKEQRFLYEQNDESLLIMNFFRLLEKRNSRFKLYGWVENGKIIIWPYDFDNSN